MYFFDKVHTMGLVLQAISTTMMTEMKMTMTEMKTTMMMRTATKDTKSVGTRLSHQSPAMKILLASRCHAPNMFGTVDMEKVSQ